MTSDAAELILLAPESDEIAVGYWGRLSFINDKPPMQFAQVVREWAPRSGGGQITGSALIDVATFVSGMSAQDFAGSHSMLPAFRVAARPNAGWDHGDSRVASRSLHGMAAPRLGAYVCLDCLHEDIERTKYSWYHRQHHLIGIDWCPIHGRVLHRVKHGEPFARPPHVMLAHRLLEPVDACATALARAPSWLRRFVSLSVHHLTRQKPWCFPILKRCLGLKAKEAGLRVAAIGETPALSDLLLKLAPSKWVTAHVNGLIHKRPLSYFSRVDDLLASSTPAAGDSCLLAMALLYPTVDEALGTITRAHQEGVVPEARAKKTLGSGFWNGDIWPVYQRHKGDLSAVAVELGVPRGQLTQRMVAAGLPHLRGKREADLMAALNDFACGMSIEEASRLHRISPDSVEDWLRVGAARMLQMIMANHSDRSRNRRRAVTQVDVIPS